jgi:23S rRNA (guanosine2251-2'-O)-methyltransferase
MTIKQVKKLNKFNIPNNAINIYGNHPAKSALLSSNRSCYLLCTTEKKFDYWNNFVKSNKVNIKIFLLETFELNNISNTKNHQGVIVIASKIIKTKLSEYLKKLSSKKTRILILDQLTDPQNVGSIIRSAFAFNFDAVCLLKNNSPIETPSLIKASAGEIDNIQILEVGNLVQEINILKKQNFFIYGLDGEGKIKIQEIDKADNRIALIIGAEGKGLRNLTKQNVDELVKIDINPKCDSLNAANATTVAMYEISKN